MNDTLYANQVLLPNRWIRSGKNEFYARLQSDGNFVIYTGSVFEQFNALWSTDTYKSSEP